MVGAARSRRSEGVREGSQHVTAITRRMGDVRSLAAAAVLSVAAAAPATHPVAIRDNAFDPPSITVAVNDTVTWTNRGQRVHTVAVQGELSSGPIQPGDDHSDTFSTPGTRTYRCEIHAEMTGTIVVQGSATTTSSSTTTTTRRPTSTTSTTEDPLGSSVTAPADSTTTSSSVVEDTTTTSTTVDDDASATGVTDSGDPDDDNVDVPSGIAAVLLLLTSAGAFMQTRGGWG